MSSRQLPFLDVSAPALVQADRYPHLRYMGSSIDSCPRLLQCSKRWAARPRSIRSRGRVLSLTF